MKKTLSLTLSFTVAFLGFISAAAPPARGQEIASAGNSITKIREDYERLLAVERNPETPPEVKEMNQNFLAERRAQLVAALRTRINALRMYQASVVSTLSAEEKQAVENSIGKLVEELESLQPRKQAPARSAQTVTASFDGARAEPVRRAPRNDGAPLEILSPDRDKTLHVSEVELEIAVNDEDIDDLMVAVYTPASEKPRSARVLNLKRSDKGTKSVVVSLAKGDNRIEVTDLKRNGVKAERNITYKTPDAPGVGAGPSASAASARTSTPAATPTPCPADDCHGHLVGALLGGAVMSQQGQQFSQADPFIGFVAGYSHFNERGGPELHWRVQGVFQVQPKKQDAPKTSATPAASPTPAPSPTPVQVLGSNLAPFMASRKTFDIDMHGWVDVPFPPVFGGTTANRDVRVGLYGLIGASTYIARSELRGDQKVKIEKDTAEVDPAAAPIDNDLDYFAEGGLIGNFYRDGGDFQKRTLYLQAIIAYGKYESMRGFNPGKTGFFNNSSNRFIGKLRIFPKFFTSDRDGREGGTDTSPMFGVEINAGRGPDQIKFFTGMAALFKKFN